jgi:hypothetical protein
LNIPFELIFIVLFFVLPALGSLQRRLRERGEAEAERSVRRPTPGPERPEAAPTRAETGQPGWLEEAQRRVREAQREESERRGRRPAAQTVNPQTPTPQAARPTRTPPPRSVQTRPVQPRSPTPASLEGRTLEGRSLETLRPERSSLESVDVAVLNTAPPLRVQRLGGGGRATIKPYEMRFDEATLMTGFIWHQVLSPPLSQSRRTRLSRRRP